MILGARGSGLGDLGTGDWRLGTGDWRTGDKILRMPFSAFVAASLALNLSPGPDMTYVAARSLAQGRRSGIISALGISVGCLFHLAAATAGIAVLLRAVPQAYTASVSLAPGTSSIWASRCCGRHRATR